MHGFNTNTDNNTDARQCQMACSAAVLPTQSILQTPLLEVINQQPKLSAASFPDNACSQPVTQTSGYTTNKIPVIPPTSVITRQPSCRLACSPAVISTQILHPETANKKQNYSAASFPDDVYSQPVIQASGNDGTAPKNKYSTDTPMQQVSLTRSWTTNKPPNEDAQTKCPDDTDECTFKNIIIEQILNIIPSVPSISQDAHLSIQSGR